MALKSYLLALAAALLFWGCSQSTDQSDVRPAGARLAPSEVLDLARRAAQNAGAHLDEYKKPDLSYQTVRANTWQVFFDANTRDVKSFYVYVDDKTEETHYIGIGDDNSR